MTYYKMHSQGTQEAPSPIPQRSHPPGLYGNLILVWGQELGSEKYGTCPKIMQLVRELEPLPSACV